MKRVNNIYDKVLDLDVIRDMYSKVRRTTKNKSKIERFDDFYTCNIASIYDTLLNRTYNPGRYNIFLISEPKIRVIMSTSIFDKLINHLVARYFLINVLEKDLIDENIATREGFGTKYGIDLIKKYLNEIKKETSDIYFLKFDISKYFYNIDHDILKSLIRRRIKDKDVLDILDKIIDSTDMEYVNDEINQLKNNKMNNTSDINIIKEIESIPIYKKGKGLPIGNMTSQFLAIYYLNELDHFIKEELGIKYYIRYMDDGVLINKDKEYLKYCLKEIENMLNKYKLKLNNTPSINHIKNSLDFLGFRFYIKDNRVILLLRNSTKKRFKKKIGTFNSLVNSNKITRKEYKNYLSSYLGLLNMGNCFYLVKKNKIF